MQGCLVAIVFSVGSVLLLGGLLSYGGNLFGASGAAIGIGAVLFVLASIAKERIDY
jgi:membrane associated rhomboid family serine protease